MTLSRPKEILDQMTKNVAVRSVLKGKREVGGTERFRGSIADTGQLKDM